MFELLDDLLDAGDGDVDGRCGGAHAAVAFVLDQAQGAGFGDGEIDAGEADFGFLEFLAQDVAADLDERIDVVGVIDAGHLFMEQAGDFLLGLVDRRHDDVRGLFVGQLDDVFAHVRFQRLDAGRFGGVVEFDFLADHGLALDHLGRAVALDDAEDDRVGLVRRFRPMHLDAVAGQVGFEAFEQFGQLGQVVLADRFAQVAQAFQFLGVGELGGALAHQEIHRATEALAQEGVVDDRLGTGAEAFGRLEVQGMLAHASSPSSRTISSFGPCAP